MNRTLVLATIVTAALVAAGVAVAHGIDAKSTKAVAGTFAATTASHVDTRTCTTSDNKTLVSTTGTYTGTATGDPDLTGNATLRAHSVINTTDGVGTVTGTLKIDVASGRDTEAAFTTVYSGGSVAGLAVGRAHDPAARLIANMSAGFSAAGGFTSGKLGGSAGGGAVEVAPGSCKPAKPVKEETAAHGTVSANANGSITVAGLTCTVPASLQSKVATFTQGSRAEIHCQLLNGVNTLTRIDK